MLVVVRLNDQMVGGTDIRLHLRINRPAVRHEHETLTQIIDAITEAIGRVMLDMEGVDPHAEKLPLHAALEIAAAGTQLLAYAIIPVDALMNLRGRIDRQLNPLAQRAYGTDMVGMIMRDKHTHDIMKIKPHLAQILLYRTRRNAGIDQDSLTTRTEVIAVSATSAGKAPKYELILLHITKSGTKVQKKNDICKKSLNFIGKICIYAIFIVYLQPKLRYYEHEGKNCRSESVDAGAWIRCVCSAGKRPACK